MIFFCNNKNHRFANTRVLNVYATQSGRQSNKKFSVVVMRKYDCSDSSTFLSLWSFHYNYILIFDKSIIILF